MRLSLALTIFFMRRTTRVLTHKCALTYRNNVRDLQRKSTVLVSGTPLVKQLHKSVCDVLVTLNLPPFNRGETNEDKRAIKMQNLKISNGFDTAFTEDKDDAVGRLVLALMAIFFRHKDAQTLLKPAVEKKVYLISTIPM